MEYGREQLINNIDNIDYVITHETPLLARKYISRQKPIDEGYIFLKYLKTGIIL